ncbi:MAG: hypothetical protein ISS70_07305 [Phycisphaerae bacterium]|nr:hypothetical protein [Phycisphaerae bacterium]
MRNKAPLIIFTFCVSISLIGESASQSIQEDRVAWGEATRGLQGGIYIQTGRWIGNIPQPPRLGEAIDVVFCIRNVSDKPVEFSLLHPLLNSPRIRNTTGTTVYVSGATYHGPAQVKTYRLKHGDSIELYTLTCMLAPRVPVYYPTHHRPSRRVAHTVPGKYRIAYELKVHSADGLEKSFNLASRWTELHVLPPDRKKLTEKVAGVLRKNIDRFNLKISRVAEDNSRLRSLKLTVLEPKEDYPTFWSVIQITREDAIAIVKFLEKSDYLWRTVADPDDNPVFNKASFPLELMPYYFLSLSLGDESKPSQLTHLANIHLGWGPDMYGRLRNLENSLHGDAKQAMKELLTQIEPFRMEWKGLSETNCK